MKKFFLLLFFSIIVCATAQEALPLSHGAVNDFAQIISEDTQNRLEALAITLERKTGFSLVILTINKLSDNLTIESYAVKIFEKWGIGKKGNEHGALIIAAVEDRAMRIETGYGSEGYLPDAVCKRIIEKIIVPAFKTGDYDGGLIKASIEISRRAAQEFNVDFSNIIQEADEMPFDVNKPTVYKTEPFSPLTTIFGILILLFLLGSRMGRWLLFYTILSGLFQRGTSYSRGGFGGGFSSRGFGGFGGGLSGGGGASGRW